MEEVSYRKIAIGSDLKDALYYAKGTKFRNKEISDIILKDGWFTVYLKKGDEIQPWKSFKESVVTVKELELIE